MGTFTRPGCGCCGTAVANCLDAFTLMEQMRNVIDWLVESTTFTDFAGDDPRTCNCSACNADVLVTSPGRIVNTSFTTLCGNTGTIGAVSDGGNCVCSGFRPCDQWCGATQLTCSDGLRPPECAAVGFQCVQNRLQVSASRTCAGVSYAGEITFQLPVLVSDIVRVHTIPVTRQTFAANRNCHATIPASFTITPVPQQ
jgi:hypothetical protein